MKKRKYLHGSLHKSQKSWETYPKIKLVFRSVTLYATFKKPLYEFDKEGNGEVYEVIEENKMEETGLFRFKKEYDEFGWHLMTKPLHIPDLKDIWMSLGRAKKNLEIVI